MAYRGGAPGLAAEFSAAHRGPLTLRLAMSRATYEVRRWSESELLNSREVWADLLRQSSADPLFNSWEWLTLWWRSFGRTLAQELCVLGIYKEGVLVALAPLYICAQRRRSISIPRSIQVLGNHWQDSDTLISEYLGLIAKVDHQE